MRNGGKDLFERKKGRSVHEQIDPEPLGGSAQKDEDVPDEVHSLMFSGKRDHADRIEDAAAKDQDEHPDIVSDHARDE